MTGRFVIFNSVNPKQHVRVHHKLSNHWLKSDPLFMPHVNMLEEDWAKNESEWIGLTEKIKTEFLAVAKACKDTF